MVVIRLMLILPIIQGGRTWMALQSTGTPCFTCAHEKDTHSNPKIRHREYSYVYTYLQSLYIYQCKSVCIVRIYKHIVSFPETYAFVYFTCVCTNIYLWNLDFYETYRHLHLHLISRRGACQQICQLRGGLCGWGARGVGEAAWGCGRTVWRRSGGA